MLFYYIYQFPSSGTGGAFVVISSVSKDHLQTLPRFSSHLAHRFPEGKWHMDGIEHRLTFLFALAHLTNAADILYKLD